MNKINSFEDLIVWQKAIRLSVQIYRLSAKFPREEMSGLTSQIRRASNSVSLNIAEGSVKSTRHFVNHLNTANCSTAEVLSAAILANELEFLSKENLKEIRSAVTEITKTLNTLIKSLERKLNG